MIHVCRDVLPWAPGSGEGHCHSLASPETDLGASVQEAFQVRCQDSACRGLGVQLGCEAVTAEVSGPHACSRAGVVLQSCVDRSLVAALPGRGHALVGGGGRHSCEAPAIKCPGNWGDPHVGPEGRLGDAP